MQASRRVALLTMIIWGAVDRLINNSLQSFVCALPVFALSLTWNLQLNQQHEQHGTSKSV